MRPAECRDGDAAVGLNAGRVAREFYGTAVVPVPSGLVTGPRALIDLLETEARRRELCCQSRWQAASLVHPAGPVERDQRL